MSKIFAPAGEVCIQAMMARRWRLGSRGFFPLVAFGRFAVVDDAIAADDEGDRKGALCSRLGMGARSSGRGPSAHFTNSGKDSEVGVTTVNRRRGDGGMQRMGVPGGGGGSGMRRRRTAFFCGAGGVD
jgi:hypothetical protein